MSGGPRHAAFPLLAAVLALGLGYALIEGGVRLAAALGGVGEYADLRYYEEKLAGPLRRGEPLAVAPVDDELGWEQGVWVSPPYDEATGSTGPPTSTVLFLGDSVTYGEIATRGENDYVTRVGEALAPAGVRVVNAAASGYGLDQMMLRLPREIEAWSPNLVVVAYIAHDLRRIGQSRFIRMTKPTLELAGSGLRVRPPEDMDAFYARQAAALSGLRYGPWLVGERWAQRRYGFPGLHLGWYEAVFDRIAARIGRDARDAEATVVFVEIPNYADATSNELLAPIMRRVLGAGGEAHGYRFVRLEDCLRAGAGEAAWPTREFSEQHPGPVGHADLAACMLSEVIGTGSSAQRSPRVVPRSQP